MSQMRHVNGRTVPASSAQQRMYFSSIVRPDSSVDAWGTVLAVSGNLDTDRLECALQFLRDRHETLRTTFLEEEGEVLQVVHDADEGVARTALVDMVEAKGDSHAERRDWAESESARMLGVPFDLSSGPLWRTSVIRVSPGVHLLVFVFHHLIIDEVSAQVFAEELSIAYADVRSSALSKPAVQYSEFCLAEKSSGVDRLGLDYWRDRLSGIQPVPLPEDSRESPGGIIGSRIPVIVPGNVMADFEAFCRERMVTPFTGMLAVYFILLQRWTGSSDITVGTPVVARPDPDFFGTIGFFANTVALRCRVDAASTFDQFIEQVDEEILGALEYQDVPFEVVVETLAPHRDADRNPLFQAAIGYGSLDPSEIWSLDGLGVTPVPDPVELSRIQFDLMLDIRRQAHETCLTIEYSRQRFSEAAMSGFADAYGNLLQSLSRAPDVPLGSIPVLGGAASAETLELGTSRATRDDHAYAEYTSAWEIFESTAATVPEREAVVAGDERLTFAELAGRARTMLVALRARGVRTGAMVGICLARRTDLIVAMLATWGAGGAFLLLDPRRPETHRPRLAEADLALVVSDACFAEAETVSPAALLADGAKALEVGPAHGTDSVRRPATAPAYTIFTSGVTGQPKSVVVDQSSLVDLAATRLAPVYDRLPEGRQVNVGALSPLTSDEFINQCLGMIAFGHRLLLLDEDERTDPLQLLSRGSDPASSIEVLGCAGSQMEILVDAGILAVPYPPQLVIIGGETASNRLWRRLHDQPGLLAFHTYGLTECTAVSAGAEIGEHPCQVAGRAAGTAQIYIVDDQLQLLPPLFVGEICVGGIGVAQGYPEQPVHTSERFIADPFSRVPGQRMYRTGDKGRLRPDGQLEFRGRLDDQVTVRGLRVEPGELEALLHSHPAIDRAAVMATDPGTHTAQLVAYVVPGDEGRDGLTYSAVRDFLRGRIPSALLPDRVEVLDGFPITPDGTLDRRALSAVKSASTVEETGHRATAVAGSRDRRLSEIVAEVVGVATAGLDDNFWELGGNSLLAMQVIGRVRTVLGCELSVRSLFEAETIGDMAVQLTAVD